MNQRMMEGTSLRHPSLGTPPHEPRGKGDRCHVGKPSRPIRDIDSAPRKERGKSRVTVDHLNAVCFFYTTWGGGGDCR